MRVLRIFVISCCFLIGELRASYEGAIRITYFDAAGNLRWTNTMAAVDRYAVEGSPNVFGPWSVIPELADVSSTNAETSVTVPLVSASNACYRIVWKSLPIADSVSGYSSVQGSNGWFYGYYDQGGSFQLFSQYGEYLTCCGPVLTNWNYHGTNSWLFLDPWGGHPEGIDASCGRMHADLQAVRRWVSSFSGRVEIDVRLKSLDLGAGNGVIGHIVADGVELDSRYIPNGGETSFKVSATVRLGSTIDCALEANKGDHCYDYTLFRATIRPSFPPDEQAE